MIYIMNNSISVQQIYLRVKKYMVTQSRQTRYNRFSKALRQPIYPALRIFWIRIKFLAIQINSSSSDRGLYPGFTNDPGQIDPDLHQLRMNLPPFDLLKAFGYFVKVVKSSFFWGKRPISLHMCATCSEIPSYESTMLFKIPNN